MVTNAPQLLRPAHTHANISNTTCFCISSAVTNSAHLLRRVLMDSNGWCRLATFLLDVSMALMYIHIHICLRVFPMHKGTYAGLIQTSQGPTLKSSKPLIAMPVGVRRSHMHVHMWNCMSICFLSTSVMRLWKYHW